MKIDFHAHILPEMDDGSTSLDMSLEMLRAEREQGIDCVVLTSHFYRHHETIAEYQIRREKAFAQLKEAIGIEKFPDLLLGAEVAMTKALCYEDLSELCIRGTNTLLLEPPYVMNRMAMKDMIHLVNQNKYTIVLAHIERFRGLWDKNDFAEIMHLPVYKQINCASIAESNILKRRALLKMIEEERVHVLGTDAHDCNFREVNYANAAKMLKDKGLESQLSWMMQNAEKLLKSR